MFFLNLTENFELYFTAFAFGVTVATLVLYYLLSKDS
jgi:hypothetical protein